jgi:hypothetical protein
MAKSSLASVQEAKANIISNIIDPGHQLNARGSAKWLRIAVFEPHSIRGQAIYYWSPVRTASIGPNGFVAQVIGHDQNDIGAVVTIIRFIEPVTRLEIT